MDGQSTNVPFQTEGLKQIYEICLKCLAFKYPFYSVKQCKFLKRTFDKLVYRTTRSFIQNSAMDHYFFSKRASVQERDFNLVVTFSRGSFEILNRVITVSLRKGCNLHHVKALKKENKVMSWSCLGFYNIENFYQRCN